MLSPGLDPLLDGECPVSLGCIEVPITHIELSGQGGLVAKANIFVLDVRDSKLLGVGWLTGNGVISFLDSRVGGAGPRAFTKNMGGSIVLREGKRVFVPSLELEAFFFSPYCM